MMGGERFEQWLRGEFVELNTALEEAYFAAGSEVVCGRPELERIKETIARQGAAHIARISGLPVAARQRYQLLGAVGLYLASCRRHETAVDPALLSAPWSLAGQLGAALGVAPRFVFAHLSLYNPAVRDRFLTFTALPDEHIFTVHNGLAVLAYERAAAALRRVAVLGVSNPLTTYLFEDTKTALDDVLRFNRTLAESLDVQRFFLNVRPYFKPYRVGAVEYRGANAGDFAAVNEIDLHLGLCRPDDPFYQGLIAEKYPYVPPDDQARLRAAGTAEPLLAAFLREAESGAVPPLLRTNARLFLDICRMHGAASAFHHHRLVKPFLEEPARAVPPERAATITASGPPLDAVLRTLERLRDLRTARDRPGLPSARTSLNRLRTLTERTSQNRISNPAPLESAAVPAT